MDFLQYSKDVDNIQKHKSFEDLQENDPELFARFLEYNKKDMFPGAEALKLMNGEGFDSTKRVNEVTDSLRKEWETPVETPVQKPVERTAMETLYGTAFPRTQRRMDENLPFGVGDVVAGGLDVLSLPARISNTIAQSPIDTWNKFVGDKTSEQIPFSTIGEIGGRSFQTPNLPSWTPDWIKKARKFVDPVAEGVGEFVTGIGRGPLLPGTFGKPIAGAVVSKMSPSILKTALGVGGNIGTGAVLGTSESIARDEGVDPFGTVLGGTLGGGLPLLGKGAQKIGGVFSDRKSGSMLAEGVLDNISLKTANKNIAERDLSIAMEKGESDNIVSELGKNLIRAKKELADALDEKIYDRSLTETVRNPTRFSRDVLSDMNNLASSRGYVGEKPTSLADAISIYTKPRSDLTPTVPYNEMVDAVQPIQNIKKASDNVENELLQRFAAGKAGFLPSVRDLLYMKSYYPEAFINPTVRSLPDRTAVAPIVRGGNLLKEALISTPTKRDSTSR